MDKVVFVLGAHRSGTSLVSAAVHSMGFELGGDFESANEENPKGFFENPRIVEFNERLLISLGGRWDNPMFDGGDALRSLGDEVGPWIENAIELVEKEFTDSSCAKIAVKDPRICQLLPFWLRV
ncbi:sulfotransferase family protein, partial [Candidatus Parcubacteria bacterium]